MEKYHGLWPLLVCSGLLLVGAALASCGQNTSAPELTPNPTQLAELQVPTITPGPASSNPAAEISPVQFTDVACLNCHTSQDILKGMTSQPQPANPSSSYAAWAGSVPPMEAWQKVYIDASAYATDIHSSINCTTCHGGQAVADMTVAHTDLIVDPAADPQKGCASCHPNIVPDAENSLHFTLAGFNTALHARSSATHYPALDNIVSEQCQTCHATCSDCHVSQPQAVGGGLVAGHKFVKTPLSGQTCAGCHGGTVQSEYEGLNEGLPPDVHEKAGLTCTDCHTGAEMHGTGQARAASLYSGNPEPTCESCHAGQIGVGSGVLLHEIHGTELIPCQTCHSVSYTNCTNCHVGSTEGSAPSYTLENQTLGFYLGKNPLISADRPWRYVPVRHIPIDVTSFDQYGTDLLDSFLSRPTWTYTTPHNIQRLTPQTSGCTACHGNNDLFLTADKVSEAERAANQQVMVDQAPALPENWQQVMANVAQRLSAEAQEPTTPTSVPETFSSYWGVIGPTPGTGVPGGSTFWGGGPTAPISTPVPAASSTPIPAPTGTPTEGESTFWGSVPEPTSTPTAEGGSFWGGGSTPTATGTSAPAAASSTPTSIAATNTPAAASNTPTPVATGTPTEGESSFWGGVPEPTSTPTAEGGSFWG